MLQRIVVCVILMFVTSPVMAQMRTVKVGFLAPLTGTHAQLGRAFLDAATLALFDKFSTMPEATRTVDVQLLPKDTASHPHGVEGAAREAIAEGATLLLGPLFRNDVPFVAKVARSAGVPVISFTNQRDVAGDGVYAFGFMPDEQVVRLFEEVPNLNIQRIAALLPNSPYGRMIGETFRQQAALYNLQVTQVVFYPMNTSAIVGEVDRLLSSSTQAKAALPDAIIIADGGMRAQDIASHVQRYTANTPRRIRILGTGALDDLGDSISPALEGAIFASAPQKAFRAFAMRFRNTYKYDPPRLAGLAYDAGALAVSLATQGSISKRALQDSSGFVGPANGIFRLRPDGTNERLLSVLEITQGRMRERSSAARFFK